MSKVIGGLLVASCNSCSNHNRHQIQWCHLGIAHCQSALVYLTPKVLSVCGKPWIVAIHVICLATWSSWALVWFFFPNVAVVFWTFDFWTTTLFVWGWAHHATVMVLKLICDNASSNVRLVRAFATPKKPSNCVLLHKTCDMYHGFGTPLVVFLFWFLILNFTC